ncbi:hypothetical protein GCM10010946_19250 [Undibacterium squillarum]|uniref:Uncharacterized protein n=1 Tax=Undibacterium squillarum TaxID=1131567 RepID=A0ABQ2XYS2_9BURK|nr:hypothetical protein GCM10010946_19250 [Undibacterium squillarum]
MQGIAAGAEHSSRTQRRNTMSTSASLKKPGFHFLTTMFLSQTTDNPKRVVRKTGRFAVCYFKGNRRRQKL